MRWLNIIGGIGCVVAVGMVVYFVVWYCVASGG